MHDAVQRHGFVLLPGGGLLAAAGAFDALRAANACLEGLRHEAWLLAADAAPAVVGAVRLAALAEAPAFDSLFVVAAHPPAAHDVLPPTLAAALDAVAARGGSLGGIDAGAAWLALGGHLDGHRCTLQPAFAEALAARHPGVAVTRNLYELDRERATCAHGTASLDMAIAWLVQRHGEHLLAPLLAHFGLERLRAGDERAPTTLPPSRHAPPKLAEALALMDANLGEPLSTQDVAVLVGLSRRQLERLFKQHLGTLPSRWYLERRLERARGLLQQTSQSILQIGLSCGFSSGAHFSNAYKSCYGRTPRDERSARAMAWRDAAAPGHHRAARPGTSP